jgi:hypothetical protein
MQPLMLFFISKAAEAKKVCSDPLAHKNASYGSSQDILKFITDLGISKVIKLIIIIHLVCILVPDWSESTG